MVGRCRSPRRVQSARGVAWVVSTRSHQRSAARLSRLDSDNVFNRSIDVQIGRLCRRIGSDLARPRYIRTERSAGYVFAVAVQTIY
jgi:DNA-binding response OmpR family regulator